MSIKLAGDLYLTNVSSGLGKPVETSLCLFEKINEFLGALGLKERYGPIDYIIVKGSTKTLTKQNHYVAFLSLEDSSKHFELKENLTNFHFNNQKVHVNVNKDETSPQTKRENKLKFKRELDRHLRHKRNKLSCSSEEAEHHSKKFKVDEQTIDEDTNDSFRSVIFVKDDQNEQTIKIYSDKSDKQTIDDLKNQIEELKNQNEKLKQSLNEVRKRECELAIEVALNQVKAEMVKAERDILKREREEAAEMTSKLNNLLKNKQEQNDPQ